MAHIVIARLFQALLVALVIGIVSFTMMLALPGDAAYRIAAGRYGYDIMDAKAAEAVRVELGLDQPVLVQLWNSFALGVVVMLILAVQLRWLPVAGYGEFKHFVLPSLALGLSLAAVSNRVIRDAVSSATQSAWFQFSLTKGLSEKHTHLRHVARNVTAPVVAYIGVQLAFLIEGVVIIESVFAWPGIGHALVHAIFERDVPMVQGTALMLGLIFVFLNLFVDLLCRIIDPRKRIFGA